MGEVFKVLRKNKNIPVKVISNESLSSSTISRFENGLNSISVERFFEMLYAINTSPEEFTGFFNYFNDQENFFDDGEYSWNLRIAENQPMLERLGKEYLQKYSKDPNQVNHLKYLAFKGTILNVKNQQYFQEKESEFIYSYLNSVVDWGKFELFVLERCIYLLGLKYVKRIVPLLHSKTIYLRKIFPNEFALDNVYINIIDCLIDFEQVTLARRLITEAENVIISDNHMVSKFYFKWYKLVIDYKMGNKKALTDMQSLLDLIELLGCSGLIRVFANDFEKYVHDNC